MILDFVTAAFFLDSDYLTATTLMNNEEFDWPLPFYDVQSFSYVENSTNQGSRIRLVRLDCTLMTVCKQSIIQTVEKLYHEYELAGLTLRFHRTKRTHDMSFEGKKQGVFSHISKPCLLYTSPSPRDLSTSRMPSSA